MQLTGSSCFATTFTLILFMTGLALGSLTIFFKRKIFKDEILVFSLLELTTGFYGLFSILLFSKQSLNSLIELSGLFAGSQEIQQGLIYASVFLGLLVPTMCMGATLPVLASYLEKHSPRNEVTLLSRLYATNTAGALAGTISCGFFMLPFLGIKTTLVAASSVNLVIALSGFLIRRKTNPVKVSREEADREPVSFDSGKEILFFLSVFISGLAFFAMESIWTRFLVIFFGSTTYALSCVLAVCLAGAASGAYLSEFFSRKNPAKSLAILLISGSLTLGICLHQYQLIPGFYLNLLGNLSPSLSDTASKMQFLRALSMVATSIWLLFIPALFLGTVFPYVIGLLKSSAGSLSKNTARLLAINLFGTVCGALLGYALFGFDLTHLFKSSIETGTNLIIMLLFLLAGALYLIDLSSKHDRNKSDVLALILAMATAFLFITKPVWNENLMTAGYSFIPIETVKDLGVDKTISLISGESNYQYYRESSNVTVAVKRDIKNNLTILSANGKVEASIPIKQDLPSPFSDISTHTIMGLSPSLFCPNINQEALIIGYGSGTTCGTTLKAGWVKSAIVIELDESIFSIDQFFQPSNLVPLKFEYLKSGRVHPEVRDARNHLALSNKKFDTIVSQPSEPWVSGSSSMYTREFFNLAASRLKDKGVFAQWIQLYSISESDLKVLLNTFQSVFKNTILIRPRNAGEIILLGRNSDYPIQYRMIEKRLKEPEIDKILNKIAITNPLSFLTNVSHTSQDMEQLKKSYPPLVNTDNNLYCEFHMGKVLVNNEESINKLIAWLENNKNLSGSNPLGPFIFKSQRSLEELIIVSAENQFCPPTISSDGDLRRNFCKRTNEKKGVISSLKLNKLRNLLSDMEEERSRILKARISQLLDTQNPEAEYFNKARIEIKTRAPEDIEDSFLEAVLARFYFEEKEFNRALTHAGRINSETTDSASALFEAGKVFLYSKNYEEAVKLFNRTIQSGNRSFEVLSHLALAKHLKGDPANIVVPGLKESLRSNSNQYVARFLLGTILFKKGEFFPALHEMIQASKVSGSDPSTNIFVTAAFIKIHHWVNAEQNLVNLEKKAPRSPFIPFFKYAIAKGKNQPLLIENLKREIEENYHFKPTEDDIEAINTLVLESSVPYLMFEKFEQKLKALRTR